ncbi:unnamed protein product, partial [Meganyctiphanes norvegica]
IYFHFPNMALGGDVSAAVTANETGMGTLSLSEKSTEVIENGVETSCISANGVTEVHWGFTVEELYRIALKFFKDKEGKAIHLGYADKSSLVGLCQQVTHGPFSPDTTPPLGVLDVVGKDRRLAWQSYGSLEKEGAMQLFVDKLSDLVPMFRPYVEALWADKVEKERLAKEEEEQRKIEEERLKLEEEEKRKEDEEKRKQEETKRQIQEALNQQTYEQFRTYAEQQFPGNPEQQGVLIRQLQDQHYQQYMQQVYQQQLLLQQQQQQQQQQQDELGEEGQNNTEETQDQASIGSPSMEEEEAIVENGHESDPSADTDEEDDSCQSIAPASMWTRRDISEFKDSIKREGGDSVIKVGHGETVTVRVPTHEDGNCLFWEFATDSYDIGFGVYFEWTNDNSNVVSVHISESEDEDEDEDFEGEDNGDDIERLAAMQSKKLDNGPPQSVIIPVYRRDCQEEVYAGSHSYPGTGVYLLKFDNSYSLWRSKTLYYRVYYTR